MKSLISWVLGIVVVVGAGTFGFMHHKNTVRALEYDKKLASLRTDFATTLASLQQLETEAYTKDIGTSLTKYFVALDELARAYPEQYDPKRELARGVAEVARGRMNEAHKKDRDERIQMTLAVFDKLKSGSYKPVFTAADKGFRFDITEAAPTKIEGEDGLKLSYMHLGVYGQVEYRNIEGNIQAAQVAGKPIEIPKIVAENQPPSLQVKGSDWVREFPPGIEFGYYELPLFPREATTVDLSFDFAIRTPGGTAVQVATKFPQLAIPESWKLAEGQKWDAEVQVADEETLQAAGVKTDKKKKK